LALFKHDIPALYAQHVDKISLTGLSVDWDDGLPSFFTFALEVNNFNDLRIENFRGGALNGKDMPAIKISDGTHAELNIKADVSIEKLNVKN
jgi:hypothetical protein